MSEEVAGGMSDTETRRVGEDPPEVRVVRILDDFLQRRERGEAVTREALLAQYPDLAGELREHLDVVEGLTPGGGEIEDLIAQGILRRSPDSGCVAELGAYRILGFLGRGGMGVVLKAYEESLNRTVALKILRPELAREAATVARFEREAKAAAALKHPNIVTVYAVGRERGVNYIAMEYVEGESLAELIRERRARRHEGTEAPSVAAGLCTGRSDRQDAGPTQVIRTSLPAETIRHIFRQLLAALDAAHAAGLIHRDVKSSNILLAGGFEDPGIRGFEGTGAPAKASPVREPLNPPILESSDPLLKLADFGLARMRSSQTQLTLPDSILGTPEYMSPEQARGDEDIDHRSDLYSAGVVLYEMLTGRTPFKAETPTATLRRIIDEEPPDPRKFDKDVDPVLASLALRLMAKRREDRFESAAEASRALDGGERVRSPAGQRMLRRSLTSLAVGALMVTGGVWAIQRITGRTQTISAAQVDPDLPYRVQVQYGVDADWKVFHEFADDRGINLLSAEVLELDGRGRQLVVVASETPLDDDNSVLIALEAGNKELWRVPLHSEFTWPDCPEPKRWWEALRLLAADLDGIPGDELVVVARDPQDYPARISRIDPRNGHVLSTYWHMGHIHEIQLLPNFLEDGRPALLAWGYNNKLDGFDDGLRHGERQLAHWDTVTAVMILDPLDMDGLGPPATGRLPALQRADYHAYSFLDLPYVHTIAQVPKVQPRIERNVSADEKPDQMGGICEIKAARRRIDDDGTGWFEISIVAETGDNTRFAGPILTVDRDLRLRNVGPFSTPTTEEQKDIEYWRQYWLPVIPEPQVPGDE